MSDVAVSRGRRPEAFARRLLTRRIGSVSRACPEWCRFAWSVGGRDGEGDWDKRWPVRHTRGVEHHCIGAADEIDVQLDSPHLL